jgi:hypothetical protein
MNKQLAAICVFDKHRDGFATPYADGRNAASQSTR